MYYLIYKVTNVINNKFYIGAHKTKNKQDDYMGSGTLIKKAIEKYGLENFKKEILMECESEKEMYKQEKNLVEMCKDSYNLKFGGEGGWDHIYNNPNWKSPFSDPILQKKLSKKGIVKIKELRKDKKFVAEWNAKISESNKGKQSFLGKKHKEETKKKIGLKNSQMIGELNSQYGTMWITNGVENKKIKKDLVIPEGWYKGRNNGR